MVSELGSTMGLLHGSPRSGQMRFPLEIRTGDAPVGPSQFSFLGGKCEDGDKSAIDAFMREMFEECHFEFPPTCYKELAELDHVTNKRKLWVFELNTMAPANLYTREGAGIAWFTAADLIELCGDTLRTPDAKFVMTPATLQVYEHHAKQGYFAKTEW